MLTDTDKISLERLQNLHPKFVSIATGFYFEVIKKTEIQWRVTRGFATVEKQKRLYENYITNKTRAPKAAPPLQSYHNYGFAIDMLPMSNDFKEILLIGNDQWNKVGEIAEKYAIVWGKSFNDRNHFEFHYCGNSWKVMKAIYEMKKFIKGTHFIDIQPF